MSDIITNNIFDKESKQKIKKTIFSDFVLRQIFRYLESANINTKNLLRNNSVAKRVEQIQTNPNHPLHDNLFIKSLLPMIEATDLNDVLFDNILLYKKKLDSYEINLLTDEFSEISKQDPTLYRDLILVNFIQAGLMNHPYQLNQILPADSYQTIVNNALFTMNIDKEELDTFFEKFVLTRPNLLEKANEYRANEYSAMYNPATKQYKVKIDGNFRTVNGNGFNILNYFGKKETNFSFNIEAITELNNNNKTSAPVEQPINKEIKPNEVKGIEINSYQTGLGNSLTNVHYATNGKSAFDIIPSDKSLTLTKEAKAKWGESVEAWYKSNNAQTRGIPEGVEGDKYDMDLMVGLITDKLKQYPNLVEQINQNGGLSFLQKSTHNMGNGRWSSKNPKNMFMNSLIQAYKNVNQPTEEDTPPWDEEC